MTEVNGSDYNDVNDSLFDLYDFCYLNGLFIKEWRLFPQDDGFWHARIGFLAELELRGLILDDLDDGKHEIGHTAQGRFREEAIYNALKNYPVLFEKLSNYDPELN